MFNREKKNRKIQRNRKLYIYKDIFLGNKVFLTYFYIFFIYTELEYFQERDEQFSQNFAIFKLQLWLKCKVTSKVINKICNNNNSINNKGKHKYKCNNFIEKIVKTSQIILIDVLI